MGNLSNIWNAIAVFFTTFNHSELWIYALSYWKFGPSKTSSTVSGNAKAQNDRGKDVGLIATRKNFQMV